jgi:hypothetical protein
VRNLGSLIGMVLVGALSAIVLILTVKFQVFDTNFYSLWEATALLAGDHPYRDFFEWGIPLQALLSAAVQRVFGYRMLGEFVTQWVFVVAGAMLAFVIGVRLSRSVLASLSTALLAVLLLAGTPIYHYPKLFFYPLAVLLALRYVETPTAARAAVLGLVTAVAFLFRHDHGVHAGVAAALAFGLAGASRPWRAIARDVAVFGIAAAVLLLPWLIYLHRSEGVIEYVRTRYQLYSGDAVINPFRWLRTVRPSQLIRSALDPGASAQEHARDWLAQVSLVVPVALLLSVGIGLARHVLRRVPPPLEYRAALLAAVFLTVVDYRLFREPGYAQVVAPLTAALAAVWLRWGSALPTGLPPTVLHSAVWRARWLAAVAVLVLTTAAVALEIRNVALVNVAETLEDAPRTLTKLRASPPIEAFMPATQVNGLRRARGDTLPLMVLARYVYDCTRDGDRVLISGSTPFDIGYLVERPIAGGHIYWHRGWRADRRHEDESLAMLQRQSVPFLIATTDPVLKDLEQYPRIYEFVRSRYTEVEGSGGALLVERARGATGKWELGLPCFK